jgi:carbonic anhydrase
VSVTDELLANNEAYVASFDKGDLPLPPAKKLAIVACMDARIKVYDILGLDVGDAHVIRNAGGVVTDDEIRSLAISQRLLGTEEIILIHHTDCGMLQGADPEGDRDQAGVGGRVVRRPRRGRPAVDRPHQGVAVHPAHGLRARVRLRRQDRQAQ